MSRGKITLIILAGIVIAAVVLLPELFKYQQTDKVNRLGEGLARQYEVEKSFDAGATTFCQRQGRTQFGDIAGTYTCSLVTAKVYYPRVQSNPASGSQETIRYTGKAGKSLQKYIQFGTPIRQPGEGNPYHVDANLDLPASDHVVFSGLSGTPDASGLGGKWFWSSETSWLGQDTPGSQLQEEISKKILANQAPAEEAPTATESLAQGRAPLVAYFITRYCHSPSLPLVDTFCILPN